MSIQKQLQTQFKVDVTVTYVPAESQPESSYFFFAYKIRINNLCEVPAQLMSRHWIITDSQGGVEEVRGAGVVGLQPKINPGKSFEYESACPLNTASGSMRGSYTMMSDEGETFEIEIPEFFLVSPTALH